MDILNTLKTKLNLDEKDLPEYKVVLKDVEKIINENHIHFNENAKMVFYAHIISFVMRLKDKEVLNGTFEDTQKEIDKAVISIAEKVVFCICDRYRSELDESEVLLIAIHIQAALLNQE